MRKWFVAMTKHQREFLASEELEKQGYQTHLPVFFRHPSDEGWAKQPHGIRFRGYVFIALDLKLEDYGPINHTRGIADDGLQLSDGVPQALRAGYMARLRRIEREDLKRSLQRGEPEPRTDLRDGDEVQVYSPGHRAHGNIGLYQETLHGIAQVWISGKRIPIPEADLKKTDKSKQSKKHNLRKVA